jgi:hypothetical protein
MIQFGRKEEEGIKEIRYYSFVYEFKGRDFILDIEAETIGSAIEKIKKTIPPGLDIDFISLRKKTIILK